MPAFLFAWNPNKWTWKDHILSDQISEIAAKGFTKHSWSCGNRKSLPRGCRFFLLRLGREPRGIIGSGLTISKKPRMGNHWNRALRRIGRKSPYVELKFDALSQEPLITWRELHRPPFSEATWAIQASGVRLDGRIARKIERLWKRRTIRDSSRLTEELTTDLEFREGTKKDRHRKCI